MSQNPRNQPNEGQGNSGRTPGESPNRKQYEGFEGMNYEQRRQPYNPNGIRVHTENTNHQTDPERRDEI